MEDFLEARWRMDCDGRQCGIRRNLVDALVYVRRVNKDVIL